MHNLCTELHYKYLHCYKSTILQRLHILTYPDQFMRQPLINVPIVSTGYYRWGIFYRTERKKCKMWNGSIKHERMHLKTTIGFRVKRSI